MGTEIRILRPVLLVTALIFSAPLSAAQETPAGPGTETVLPLRERIELAHQRQNFGELEQTRSELLTNGSERAGYLVAYARFRQALAAGDDRAAARGYLDGCIAELEAWLARHPPDAEARALLGSCYGISTRYHRLGMARRGLEARRQMAIARQLAPDNPWVVLQDGLADYATPRLFGGDRQRGISKVERSTALFAGIVADSRAAGRGATEAWLQLARMYAETGRPADAAGAIARAEALAPERDTAPARLAAAD